MIAPGTHPRIAYSTTGPDLSAPGDRRRFCHWAARRDVAYEVAQPGRSYDVVVASYGSDLGVWSRLPRTTRLVFDMVDSHLAMPRGDSRTALRGLIKFAFRRTQRLHLDYRALIEATCRRADAVICTTEEQRQDILKLCPNVHVILDFQPEATTCVKTDYASGPMFHLVWEGLPWNLVTFRVLADALAEIQRRHSIALHLLTHLDWPLLFGDQFKVSTRSRLRGLIPLERIYLYEWNGQMFAPISTACDLAIIPIPLDHPMFAGKPENKLVQFWRMGVPVVASATPAYERAMRGAGLSETCRDTPEWIAAIERMIQDQEARRTAGERGRAYAESNYPEAKMLAQWDAVFTSIGA